MTKSQFLSFSLICSLGFIFIKIYQHNRMVQCGFEKQRFERAVENRSKEKNNLLAKLYTFKNFDTVKTAAQEKFGMKQLKLSQIITVTEPVRLDPSRHSL